jgi:hypothetical protein
MADILHNDGNGGGSATTVLVTVVIIAIIGLAFYFGFARGNWGGNDGGANINVTVPTGTEGGGIAE